MSSDDAQSPSNPKHPTSTLADVFRTLSVGRPKSHSPVSILDGSGDSLAHAADGRRSSRIVFGLESMHRGSVVSNSSDAPSAPDFEACLKNLTQQQNLTQAIEEADYVSRSLQWFTSEQSAALLVAGTHLLRHESSAEARRSGSRLMEAVAARQDLAPTARRSVFESISCSSEPDVIPARVQSLALLSDHGRKLDFTTLSVVPLVSSCVVPLYELIASTRLKARKAKVTKANGFSHDDASLDNLLQFAVDLITLQRKPPTSEDVESLLDQVFTICKKTSAAADIKNSLAVFDAIILYADIPDASFVPMLEVLCSIHASVKSLSGPTSRAVRNLARSRRQAEMVDALYSFLLESPQEHGRNLNVVRGTIYVLADLIRARGQEGIPQLNFEKLMDSLQVAVGKDDARVESDVLELCLNVLEGDFTHVALEQNWSGFINLIAFSSRRAFVESEDSPASPSSSNSPHLKASTPDDTKSSILANVIRIASLIESLWDQLNQQQRQDTGRFLMNACQHIEPSQAELILNSMRTEKSCSPENSDWEIHCQKLISSFIRSDTKPSDIRILALDTLREDFSTHESLVLFLERGLLSLMLESFSEEDDILFLESLVSFLVDISILVGDDDTFRLLVETLSSRMRKDWVGDEPHGSAFSSPTSPQRHPSTSILEISLANVCSVGLVRMFLRCLNQSASKAVLVFEALLDLAQSAERPTDARLTVFKLLFRLRCDSSGSITVASISENDFLMDVLGRSVEAGSKLQPISEDSLADHGADHEVPQSTLTGRHSISGSLPSKSTGRGTATLLRSSKLTPPVWTYASPQVLPEKPPDESSPFLYAYAKPDISQHTESDPALRIALKANMWLETIISLLQRETNWDIYSYILTHLGPQLSNKDFFHSAIPQIKLLRSVMCDQVKNETFREPPASTGVKKTDVVGCIFECLTMLIGYNEHFAKSEADELVRAFMMGIMGSWGGTSRKCIHALSVCCYEIPLSVTKSLNGILDKMSKVITMSNLAVHILEFLALLARLPDVYINLREEEIRTLFGICIRFLQTSREQRHRSSELTASRGSQITRRVSAPVGADVPATEQSDPSPQDGMSTYIYTLTHHVMVFWFLSLKLQDRAKQINWITSRLIFKDEFGKETVEEQSQVFIDFMQRVAFSDLGETIPYDTFPPSPADGPVSQKSWVVGSSIITVETAGVSGLTQITKRQASGTTYATYQQRTAPVLPHQVPPTHDSYLHFDDMRTAIFPSHVMLQLSATAFPTPTVMQPISLADDDMTRRAISSFDRNDIVDGHKIGVVYIENGQTTEAEILSNAGGSNEYEYFLSGLGTKVPLRGARFNTQGLHPDIDGDSTYAWRDRVTEIVYHVVTMMPTDFDRDPACINKKRHIGNDFVNIIFNHSNLPFNFHTIPSQFNFVNIVISPVCRIANDESGPEKREARQDPEKLFYLVKVMSKPGFPEISCAATPKIISGKNLAAFVRILALNASVFSLVWHSEGGDHVSSWRNRLREIKRVRERALAAQSQNLENPEVAYPGQRRNTKANIFSEELPARSPVVKTDFASDWDAAADEGKLLQNLDFSRWSR